MEIRDLSNRQACPTRSRADTRRQGHTGGVPRWVGRTKRCLGPVDVLGERLQRCTDLCYGRGQVWSFASGIDSRNRSANGWRKAARRRSGCIGEKKRKHAEQRAEQTGEVVGDQGEPEATKNDPLRFEVYARQVKEMAGRWNNTIRIVEDSLPDAIVPAMLAPNPATLTDQDVQSRTSWEWVISEQGKVWAQNPPQVQEVAGSVFVQLKQQMEAQSGEEWVRERTAKQVFACLDKGRVIRVWHVPDQPQLRAFAVWLTRTRLRSLANSSSTPTPLTSESVAALWQQFQQSQLTPPETETRLHACDITKTVVLMVGVPGAMHKIVAGALGGSMGWVTLRQEDKETRNSYEHRVCSALERSAGIVVDRSNHTHTHRAELLQAIKAQFPGAHTIALWMQFDKHRDLPYLLKQAGTKASQVPLQRCLREYAPPVLNRLAAASQDCDFLLDGSIPYDPKDPCRAVSDGVTYLTQVLGLDVGDRLSKVTTAVDQASQSIGLSNGYAERLKTITAFPEGVVYYGAKLDASGVNTIRSSLAELGNGTLDGFLAAHGYQIFLGNQGDLHVTLVHRAMPYSPAVQASAETCARLKGSKIGLRIKEVVCGTDIVAAVVELEDSQDLCCNPVPHLTLCVRDSSVRRKDANLLVQADSKAQRILLGNRVRVEGTVFAELSRRE
eukprot:c39264_g1_i1.p1 GENE.c39264_g1_i1~~c39264_g1_i1.p1  ORF type:complete len:670 (+),score=100.09 c39264_g1_i1:1270-3279(+)